LGLTRQLLLPVRLNDEATFDNFLVAPRNALAVDGLRGVLAPGAECFCYLHGPVGSGRSHLLQALCHQAAATGACYLPLTELVDYPAAEVLEGLDDMALLCLDDIDAVLGKETWDEALFHLYNRRQAAGLALCVSAAVPAREAPTALPDLGSRLLLMLSCRLQLLDEADRGAALQLRARQLGIGLSDDVVSYILRRLPRDMASLVAFLHRLDHLSIAEKRRITVPFVGELLARDGVEAANRG